MSRRYTISSNNEIIDGNTYTSIYEFQRDTEGMHGECYEEVYNAEKDKWESTGSFLF